MHTHTISWISIIVWCMYVRLWFFYYDISSKLSFPKLVWILIMILGIFCMKLAWSLIIFSQISITHWYFVFSTVCNELVE